MTVSKVKPETFIINDDMRRSAVMSGTKRNAEKEKAEKEKREKQQKWGKKYEEISTVARQIKEVQSTKSELLKEADKLYDDAQKPDADMKFLWAKGNSMRKCAKDKEDLIGNLQSAVEKLREEQKKLKKQ